MKQPARSCPGSAALAERQARRATAALFARIAADRRRLQGRPRASRRDRLIDLVVAMATYSGLTVAVVLGTVWGLRLALAQLFR